MDEQANVEHINNPSSNQGAQGVFHGSVHFIQYYQEQTSRKLLKHMNAFNGYIKREEEEKRLTELIQVKGPEPTFLSGMSGTGKTWLATQVIHELLKQDPCAFPGGILWESLADLDAQHLLHQCLDLIGHHTTSHSGSYSPRNLFWELVAQRTECLLVVFDDVRDEQQLAQILPDQRQALPNCCILVICTQQPFHRVPFDQKRHLELTEFNEQEIENLFKQHLKLSQRQMELHKKHLDEIVQRLGSLPLLLSTAARDMASGNISPGSYLLSLREQDNPSSRKGRAVVDGLELALRDLSDEQRDLFTFIGVLGEGSWRLDMLAAVVIRRPSEIRSDLEILVKRGLVQVRTDKRYQVNVIVREFAQQLLLKQPPYIRHAAYTCLAHDCLSYARRLTLFLMERPDMRAIAERSMPHHNVDFVRAYHNLISLESSHIRQAITWTVDHEEWILLLQFADVSSSELVQYLVASVFDELKLTLSLATLVEPIIWQQADVVEPKFQSFISTGGLQYTASGKDSERQDLDVKHYKSELGLNIHAGRIIDGFFEHVCFLDTRWVGVRAAGLICRDIELIGCEFIACDLSQSIWINGDARQLTLTGSILNYALLHNVRLHRADLRDADLTGAVFEKVKLQGADLRNCNLTGALFNDVDLRGADLRGARVDEATFQQVRFQGCRADGVNWTTASMLGDLSPADRDEIMTALGPEALHEDKKKALSHPRTDAQAKFQRISTSKKEGPNLPKDLNFTRADLRAISYKDILVSDCQFSRTDFRATQLTNIDFSGADLQGADLRGARLVEPLFRKANMRGVDLRTTVMKDANLEEADLTDAEMRFAVIQQGHLQEVRLRGARLRNATLTDAHLQGAELIEVDLSYANLERAQLQGATLVKADLRGARLAYVNLSGVDLSGACCDEADFTGAALSDEDLARAASWRDAILPTGKQVLLFSSSKGTSLEESREQLRLAYLQDTFEDIDLGGYDLFGAQLTGDFVGVRFTKAILNHARLPGDFSIADFTHASLQHTLLCGIFTATHFDEAILIGARLSGIFANCTFKTVDLREATCEGAGFVSCDFAGTQVDTQIFKQALRLRGCILPDGTRYDGRFNLPGDRQDAVNYGYDLEVPEQRVTFYSGKKLRMRSI